MAALSPTFHSTALVTLSGEILSSGTISRNQRKRLKHKHSRTCKHRYMECPKPGKIGRVVTGSRGCHVGLGYDISNKSNRGVHVT